MNFHEPLMQHCLSLARQGELLAHPNPLVGSIVLKNGEVVGQGSHERFGEAHAEVNALRQAGEKARGATLYVSLEPCCITAKTGPCSRAIIDAGITEVVYGMLDPNPAVSGKGLSQLVEAGIKITGPVLEKECQAVNVGFTKRMTKQLPWLRAKLAMSLDGRTAMSSGESQWITGAEAREDVQLWRARSDAVITGIDTVLFDKPSLNVRLPLADIRQPLRVIVDSSLRTPGDAPVVTLPGRVLIATAQPREKTESFQAAFNKPDLGVRSFPGIQGKVDLKALLHYLATVEQCGDVLLESGATLAGAFLQAGLVDELITYIAPSLMGSEARPLLQLAGISAMQDRINLELLDVARVGKDCRMRSLVKSRPDN